MCVYTCVCICMYVRINSIIAQIFCPLSFSFFPHVYVCVFSPSLLLSFPVSMYVYLSVLRSVGVFAASGSKLFGCFLHPVFAASGSRFPCLTSGNHCFIHDRKADVNAMHASCAYAESSCLRSWSDLRSWSNVHSAHERHACVIRMC